MNHDQPPRRIDQPGPCFLRMRMARHAPFVGARIFNSLGMLAAEINGIQADVDHVWTSGEFIGEAEYLFLMEAPPADPYEARRVSQRGLMEAMKEQAESDWFFTRPIR